jgi:hypothetical protein
MRDVAEAREGCMIAIKFLSESAGAQRETSKAKAQDCLELYKQARERLERHIRDHQCF